MPDGIRMVDNKMMNMNQAVFNLCCSTQIHQIELNDNGLVITNNPLRKTIISMLFLVITLYGILNSLAGWYIIFYILPTVSLLINYRHYKNFSFKICRCKSDVQKIINISNSIQMLFILYRKPE